MSHLIHLKRRIKSIKTTEKITHAMRLIAMSLYSKLEKQNLPLNYYVENLQKLFIELSQQCPNWKNKIFLPEDILNSKPLFIVISATKGFCGGLNNNLFRYLEHKVHIEEHQTPTFLTIGKKATAFVQKKNFGPIFASYHDLNSNNFADISRNIAKIITNKPEYSSVTIYSSFFKNFFAQKPTISNVIPLKQNNLSEKISKESTKEKISNQEELTPDEDILEEAITNETSEEEAPIWEQNSVDIVNFVAGRYLDAHLTNILFQALISEYASRFVAMDNATTNAENYLETLTLQFNKLRQALITREVSELSASL